MSNQTVGEQLHKQLENVQVVLADFGKCAYCFDLEQRRVAAEWQVTGQLPITETKKGKTAKRYVEVSRLLCDRHAKAWRPRLKFPQTEADNVRTTD